MTLFKTCFLVLSGLLYPLLIWSKTAVRRDVSAIAVPLFVLSMIVYTYVSARGRSDLRASRPFLWAFVMILAGDCIFNWTPWEMPGLVPFAAAHFLLGLYFISRTGRRGGDWASAIPVAAASLLFFLRFSPALKSPALSIVLAAYLAVLSFMTWRAVEVFRFRGLAFRFRAAVLSGALCFYFSDLLVLLNSIAPPAWGVTAAWILYPPALFLLSVSSGMARKTA